MQHLRAQGSHLALGPWSEGCFRQRRSLTWWPGRPPARPGGHRQVTPLPSFPLPFPPSSVLSSSLLWVPYSAPALLAAQPLWGFTGCCQYHCFPHLTGEPAHSSPLSPALSSTSTDIYLLSGQPGRRGMGRRAPTHTYTHIKRLRQSGWMGVGTQQVLSKCLSCYHHHSTGDGAHTRSGQQLCLSEPLLPRLQTGGDENPNLPRPRAKLIEIMCTKCPACSWLWQPDGRASWLCLHLRRRAVVAT